MRFHPNLAVLYLFYLILYMFYFFNLFYVLCIHSSVSISSMFYSIYIYVCIFQKPVFSTSTILTPRKSHNSTRLRSVTQYRHTVMPPQHRLNKPNIFGRNGSSNQQQLPYCQLRSRKWAFSLSKNRYATYRWEVEDICCHPQQQIHEQTKQVKWQKTATSRKKQSLLLLVQLRSNQCTVGHSQNEGFESSLERSIQQMYMYI